MPNLDREQLQTLLSQWSQGKLSISELHQAAEQIWENGGQWPTPEHSDPASITIEVLSFLECLNHQRLTLVDLPALNRFLETPPGAEQQAWLDWESYWAGVDFSERLVGDDGYVH